MVHLSWVHHIIGATTVAKFHLSKTVKASRALSWNWKCQTFCTTAQVFPVIVEHHKALESAMTFCPLSLTQPQQIMWVICKISSVAIQIFIYLFYSFLIKKFFFKKSWRIEILSFPIDKHCSLILKKFVFKTFT